jgi:hypothetical protein
VAVAEAPELAVAAAGMFRTMMGETAAVVEGYLRAGWRGLSDVSEDAMWPWAADAAVFVEAAQANVAQQTDAYLAVALDAAPVGVPAEDATTMALRGVDGAELWTRPPRETWWRLSEGDTVDEARRKGLERALALAATNLQLAHTHTARNLLDRRPGGRGVTAVVRYRRLTRGARSCELCLLAAGDTYATDALMPVHTRCHCVVVPVQGRTKAPLLGADGRAAQADARAAGVEVDVRDHGEIGPVLTRRGEHFKGEPRPTSPSRVDDQAAAVEAEMTD